jgi:transcription initiation factor TFIIIB Brf1 subunit/transcription initiation factor TFIIB
MMEQAELYNKILDDISSSINYAEETKKCCDNPYYIDLSGFCVCNGCGVTKKELIFDDDIFSFNTGDDCKFLHSKINELYPESSKGTLIGGNSKMSKIHSWNSMPYNERVVWEVSNVLKMKLSGYFSQKVITDSVYLYKEIYSKMDITRGENKSGMIAACVYFSARKNNADHSPKGIAKVMDVDISILNKCTKIYTETIGFSENVKSSDFVDSYCNKLELSFRIKKVVRKLCDTIDDYGILNCFPQNTCVGVIIFACKEMGKDIDIKDVCKTFEVSSVTMTKIYKKILEEKQNILSKSMSR